MKYSGIGGQAVIEGIMMQNGENYAVAVRKPDGEIEVKKDTYRSVTKKYPFLGIPFIRGVFKFADSMIVGMRALTWSCSFFEDDEDAKESRFEQWLDKVFGEKLESIRMYNIGKNMAWLLKCIALGRENGLPHPDNEKVLTNFIR